MYHTWKRNTALFVIFSIVLSLARVDATASTLFYYGNPANGTLYSLDSQGNSAPVYDTLVSLPSALTVNGTRVYFANNSPNLFPTISYVDVSPVSAPQGGFSAGVSGNATNVFVSSIRVFGSTLIFSYGGVDVSFDNVTFSNAPLICAIDINDATKNVEVLLDSTKLNGNIVTSFAVDSTSGDIYLTTNNAEFGSGGFIYSFPYPQDETTTLTQIFSTENDISSIQIGPDNNLYFISNAVDVTMFNTVNNKTKANTFAQPLSQIEFVGNDLYIRALNGDVFLSQNTTATKVVTLPQEHVTDSAMSATGNNVTVYYVGVDTSAVLSVVIPSNYTTVNAFAVATGFGANSFTWVDLDSEVLYYAAYNQINALTEIDSGSPQWEHVYTTDTPIIALTGDLSTGDVLAITEHQIYHFVKSTMAVRSAQTSNTITAITVDSSSSTIYFSYASSASSTDSPVHYCTLPDCTPDTITSLTGLTPEGDIISLYVHENSQTLYYSTEKGVYAFALGGNGNESTSVFAATPAIKPFAVLAATTGDLIYFLDVQNSTTTLFACTYPLCKSVQNLAQATGNVSKPGDTAWIAYDDSTASLFWSSSSLGSTVMSYDLTTSISAILTTTPTAILGLSASEGTVYVSTLDGLVSYFAANGTKTGQCPLPTGHVVGAVNAFNSTTFLWADYNVATVTYCSIGCLTGCVGNGTFATANVDTVNCPHLQFITVTEEFVYNQNGCGGIMRTPLGSTEPEKLKEADTYPIAGLTVFAGSDVTNTSTSLAWALPYRYSIVNVYEDANTTEILRPHTVYTGSGSVMTSLFVTNANVINAEEMGQHTTVFWNDVTTAKLLKYEYGAVSDASLDYVVALSNFVTTPTPSPSVTPTPSATQSPSVSSTASPSISDSLSVYATPSGTASATGSVLASVSAAATVTPTATSTASATTSVSATGSVSPSFVDNGGATVSSAPSATTTTTFSLGSSPSTTASATPSISQSYSVGYTYSTTNTGNILATMGTTEDTKLISKEEWEWIIVILFLVIICCIAPCSFYCWRKGVEKEMAMSLRLPTDDEPLLGYNDQIL